MTVEDTLITMLALYGMLRLMMDLMRLAGVK